MLEKAIQVKSSWPFPCFPLLLGLTKHCFFITNEEELCNEKQCPLHVQGWVDPCRTYSYAADSMPTGQFLKR